MSKNNIENERAAFDAWHFNDRNDNCGQESDEAYAKIIYDRVYTHPHNITERERSFFAWQAATDRAAKKLEGFAVVPIKPTHAMIDAVRSEHEGEPYLPYSLYKSFLKAAMIEATKADAEGLK